MPFSPDPSGVDRNVPTVAAGAGLGTSPPAPAMSATSDDYRGTISFGSGATPAAGTALTITFARPKDANRLPVISLQEATQATAGIDFAVGTVTSTSFTIVQATRLVTASQPAGTYALNYTIVD